MAGASHTVARMTTFHRALLCVEVLICFGPVLLLLLLGLMASPIWIATVAGESIAPDASAWDGAWPLAAVTCGVLGLWSMVRLLRLLMAESLTGHNPTTWALLCAGLGGLLLFSVVAGPLPVALDPEAWLALTLYFLLPVACAGHLVFLARKKLSVIQQPT
jgi:hypothetical protein